jgi:tetratricopeptide (TPR) repeat protein
MVFPVSPLISGVSRLGRFAAPAVWLAVALGIPLAGCSFDLGSWGSDNDKPKAAAEKTADPISSQNVSDAKGHATRGQILARSGKNDEALAEFDTALALDPYNTQALYGRGLIYQIENQHQQAIEDFTTANGLAPQRVEPLLGRDELPRRRQGEGSRGRSRRGGAGRSEQRTGLDRPRAGL